MYSVEHIKSPTLIPNLDLSFRELRKTLTHRNITKSIMYRNGAVKKVPKEKATLEGNSGVVFVVCSARIFTWR